MQTVAQWSEMMAVLCGPEYQGRERPAGRMANVPSGRRMHKRRMDRPPVWWREWYDAHQRLPMHWRD